MYRQKSHVFYTFPYFFFRIKNQFWILSCHFIFYSCTIIRTYASLHLHRKRIGITPIAQWGLSPQPTKKKKKNCMWHKKITYIWFIELHRWTDEREKKFAIWQKWGLYTCITNWRRGSLTGAKDLSVIEVFGDLFRITCIEVFGGLGLLAPMLLCQCVCVGIHHQLITHSISMLTCS